MDDRTQRLLDGNADDANRAPLADLTPAEAARLREAEAMIARVVAAVPRESAPDLAPAVLRRIAALEAAAAPASTPIAAPAAMPAAPAAAVGDRARAALAWLWSPRAISLRLRPAFMFVPAAAVALMLVLRPVDPGSAGPDAFAPMADAAPPAVLVEFRLDAPDAQRVQLAGNFTEWQPTHSLARSEPGVWTVVVPLQPGVHEYAFVVDGEQWVPDPQAPAVDDGFGGFNSRLAVLTPDARSAGSAALRQDPRRPL